MSLLDESVAQALKASRIVGKRQSYLADNPIEGKVVIAYLNGGQRPMNFVTAMAKHLVALEDARRAVTPSTGKETYSGDEYSSGIYSE